MPPHRLLFDPTNPKTANKKPKKPSKSASLARPACASGRWQLSFSLRSLSELVLDQNLLSVLPTTLWDLKALQTLKVARNRLALPPDKLGEMRALVLAVSVAKSLRFEK